jgi:hypothetical protein
MKIFKWTFICIGTWLMFSVLLIGPIVYSLIYLRKHVGQTIYTCISVPAIIFASPNFIIAYYSELYYNYINWWAEKANVRPGSPSTQSHNEFKNDIRNIFGKNAA